MSTAFPHSHHDLAHADQKRFGTGTLGGFLGIVVRKFLVGIANDLEAERQSRHGWATRREIVYKTRYGESEVRMATIPGVVGGEFCAVIVPR